MDLIYNKSSTCACKEIIDGLDGERDRKSSVSGVKMMAGPTTTGRRRWTRTSWVRPFAMNCTVYLQSGLPRACHTKQCITAFPAHLRNYSALPGIIEEEAAASRSDEVGRRRSLRLPQPPHTLSFIYIPPRPGGQ